MILRQIGRVHWSIKGSYGAAEGWNNGWWKWQKTQRCSLLNGLCRGGNYTPLAWLYTEDKTAQLKIGAYLTDFVCVFVLCSVIALTQKVACQRTENVTAICKARLTYFLYINGLLSAESSSFSLIFSANLFTVMGLQETFILPCVFSKCMCAKNLEKQIFVFMNLWLLSASLSFLFFFPTWPPLALCALMYFICFSLCSSPFRIFLSN